MTPLLAGGVVTLFFAFSRGGGGMREYYVLCDRNSSEARETLDLFDLEIKNRLHR